jgi:pimeloyl-ACP methyl ester carboxylesterase
MPRLRGSTLVAMAGATTALVASGFSAQTSGAANASLPAVSSGALPGPAVLYRPVADAPQLDNVAGSAWVADPILVSGAEEYSRGEFLYQGYLYDDHGAAGVPDPNAPVGPNAFLFSPSAGTFTYPTGPGYDNNAANLLEFRVKPLASSTLFRVTLNTLQNPRLVGFTIALGGTPGVKVKWPHAAGISSPATYFLTVHGTGAATAAAEFVNARTGAAVGSTPVGVRVFTTNHQFEIAVPHTTWNPGSSTVRMTIGVGLWDQASNGYLVPSVNSATATTPGGGTPTSVAIVNVGPRLDRQEPYPSVKDPVAPLTLADSAVGAAEQARWWRERTQANALRLGDVSSFFAEVNFAKLAAGVFDDAAVPKTGVINRILASHFSFGQGMDPTKVCFDLASNFSAGAACVGRFVGNLQPYSLYIPPNKRQPANGWGLTLLLHSLSANYNQYSTSRNQSQLGERGNHGAGSLVLTPSGRGPDGFYAGYAEADTFEAWADVASHYPLDPAATTVSGYSMGGFGTYRLLARYPDLFSKGFSTVGIPGTADPLVPNLRNTPIMAWNDVGDELVPINESEAAEQELAAAGLRFTEFLFLVSDHLTLATNDQYEPAALFLGTGLVNLNPAHVTYVIDPSQDNGAAGVTADHAYWISGVTERDTSQATGEVDARSRAFGIGDATPTGVKQGAGVLFGGNHVAMPYVSREQDWGTPPATPVLDELDITATNVSALVIDPVRAGVDCNAVLKVSTNGPVTITLSGCGSRTFQ